MIEQEDRICLAQPVGGETLTVRFLGRWSELLQAGRAEMDLLAVEDNLIGTIGANDLELGEVFMQHLLNVCVGPALIILRGAAGAGDAHQPADCENKRLHIHLGGRHCSGKSEIRNPLPA